MLMTKTKVVLTQKFKYILFMKWEYREKHGNEQKPPDDVFVINHLPPYSTKYSPIELFPCLNPPILFLREIHAYILFCNHSILFSVSLFPYFNLKYNLRPASVNDQTL